MQNGKAHHSFSRFKEYNINPKHCLTWTRAASRYLRQSKRLSTEKLFNKQSILINSNLRRAKAGFAAAEHRVDHHKGLLRAQQWICTQMFLKSGWLEQRHRRLPGSWTRAKEVKSPVHKLPLYDPSYSFFCPPPRGPQPREPPVTNVIHRIPVTVKRLSIIGSYCSCKDPGLNWAILVVTSRVSWGFWITLHVDAWLWKPWTSIHPSMYPATDRLINDAGIEHLVDDTPRLLDLHNMHIFELDTRDTITKSKLGAPPLHKLMRTCCAHVICKWSSAPFIPSWK